MKSEGKNLGKVATFVHGAIGLAGNVTKTFISNLALTFILQRIF